MEQSRLRTSARNSERGAGELINTILYSCEDCQEICNIQKTYYDVIVIYYNYYSD